MKSILPSFLIGFLLYAPFPLRGKETGNAKALVIVLDGLRPDYVTPGLMPNLNALGKDGVVYENHHSVYPTKTRVNSPSISTGSYPSSHGLMGNSVYFPRISKKGLSTSSFENLRKIEKSTGGRLLTFPSAGEVLEKAGKTVFATSSGSGGSAYLLNHKGLGGGVIGVGAIFPASIQSHVLSVLGPVPPDARPSAARNAWAVNAYLKIGIEEVKPDLTFLWITDPDHTAHHFGIGAPETNRALRLADAEIGRILEAHKEHGMENEVDIFVTSDHGFSTREAKPGLSDLLKKHHLDKEVTLVDGGALYLNNFDKARVAAIVKILQGEDSVGAIFTRGRTPRAMRGIVPGTFSFFAIHWDHERAADIQVSPDWRDAPNRFGYSGFTRWGTVAGHGSSSPYDIHNTLIMAGPDIKRNESIKTPSCNVDLAATIYQLLGVPPPEAMGGRILKEALLGGPGPAAVKVKKRKLSTRSGGYHLELNESIVEGKRYFDFTRVSRD